MRPAPATERSDGIRSLKTSISRPSTVSVVTSNIPPGPVSWARTSALVGIYFPLGSAACCVVDDVSATLLAYDTNAHMRHPRHLRSGRRGPRSEEHTSELQFLMRISYAVFCLKKKK